MNDIQRPEEAIHRNLRPITRALTVFRNVGLIVAVSFTLVSAAFLLFVGAYQGLVSMTAFLTDWEVKLVLTGLIKTMDIFLAALVMMLLSLGLYDLFVVGTEKEGQKVCSGWGGFSSTLDSLKNSLAKLIVIILIITFLELVLASLDNLTGYLVLVVPAGVFLTAISLWFMKKSN